MAGKTMNAVQYESYGGGTAGLKHVQIPIPKLTGDELLIKVEAVSLNPIDWKTQEGQLRPFLPAKFPAIPGSDIAGEVIEVGHGVNSFKPGDKVVAKLNQRTGGGLAEFAVSSSNLTVKRPSEVSAVEASAIPVAAETALQSLKHTGTKFDGTDKPLNILITAASGGVGHYAVQLAKLANHHVTATCGARNLEFIKSLGADEVLDYKTPEGASLKSPSDKKYDFVIHCTTSINWSVFEPNLSPYGRVIDLTAGPGTFLRSVYDKITFAKKRLVPLMLAPKKEELEFLVELVKDGKLKSVIDSKFALSSAEEAWARGIEGHATGKIVVEPWLR